ncbi:hypothetical protein [Mycobacterium sp. Marseille-P9652]|uniref:hypothetical protein n=1 Tax=Mycobacterium sp. Marseille-P9652 TaxID=2654950 RepID=UPI0012E91F8F|nr:hypothetical protein [Mycobacterium sp. Marseille-P9652]
MRQIFTVAAAPVALAAMLAVAPAASVANLPLGFDAAIHTAPLDPCDLDPNCNNPGYPGGGNSGNIPGDVDPVPGNDNSAPGTLTVTPPP